MKKEVTSTNIRTIKALKSGNEKVFAAVYKDYYTRLFAFSLQFLPEKDCEEIVQDTMLWLWENKLTLIPEMSLHALLFTIVKNKCLNKIDQSKTRNKIQDKLMKLYMEHAITQNSYDFEELKNRFYQALSKIPKDHRQAFIQNRFENLSYQDIAEKENISVKTVAYRISQALKQLRISLKDYLPLLIGFV